MRKRFKIILHLSETHHKDVLNFHQWRDHGGWNVIRHADKQLILGNTLHMFGSEERHERLKGCSLDRVVIYGNISKGMMNSVIRPALLHTNGEIEYI